MRRRSLVVAVMLMCASAHAATDVALDKVLRQMDAASAKFKSAEADLRWDFYEKVVRDTTTQTGTIYFLHGKTGTEMGAVIGPKYLRFANGNGAMFDRVSKKTTPFSAGQDRARAESFLTLGFGGSGKDLEKAWTIKLVGMEAIDGTPTVEMDLTPKEASVANMFTHILIWIDTTRGISLKQQSFTPEGDNRTAYYTHVKYNLAVNQKKFAAPKH